MSRFDPLQTWLRGGDAARLGADTLSMTLKGQRSGITAITAWDRHRDWALLPAPEGGVPLTVAGAPAMTGDRCYSLEAGSAGTRVLAEGSIIGKAEVPSGGSRLIASFTTGLAAPGAPVVNEFGEAIGVIGGGLTPGQTTFSELAGVRSDLRGVPVVPVSIVSIPASPAPTSLAELRQKGITMAPAIGEGDVMEAGFAHDIQRATSRPIDQREQFTAADQHFFVFVAWEPRTRLRGTLKLRVYDDDNRLIVESKPGKADFKPASTAFSQWQVPVPARPAIYHADVIIGDATMWRGFLTVR